MGSYSAEFKGGTPSRRDVHRILVAFTLEADQLAFKSLRHVLFKDEDGTWLHGAIGQDRISYDEILGISGDNGTEKVYIVLKKMPDSWTQNETQAAFTAFTWEARGFEHPFLAEFVKVTWFRHKSGVQRRMLIVEVIPHNQDPRCVKLPSIYNPRPGKTTPFIIGCSLHKCDLCGEFGHRAKVHDNFKGRPRSGKRHASGSIQAKDGKRRKLVTKAELIQRASLIARCPVCSFLYLLSHELFARPPSTRFLREKT